VELVNCFKNARDRLGINGGVYAADITNTAPAVHFADKYFIIPRINQPNYIDSLIKICSQYSINLVVPTIDTELEILALNRERIEKISGVKVMISNYDAVSACCDKYKTMEYFDKYGIDYPERIDINGKQPLNFPLFIKPYDGSSSINTFKVNNKTEYDFFINYVKNPIVQEYIDGTEYTVDCFCDFDGKIISVVPRIRLATRSGEILKGRIDKNRTIIENAKRVIKAFGFIGHITLQCFLCKDGRVLYIEINPRFGGGAPMSIMSGADTPSYLYRLLRGEKLEYSEDYSDGDIYSRYDTSLRIPSDDKSSSF
jgi:carbamoyl-phosphate synthase large subunit